MLTRPIPGVATLRTRLSKGLLVGSVVLVVIAMAITSYRNAEARRSAEWVAHTYEVISTTDDLLKNIRAAESLFEDIATERHTPYAYARFTQAYNRMDTLKDHLQRLVANNQRQSELLRNQIIRPIIRQQTHWRSHLDSMVALDRETKIGTINPKATLDTIFVNSTRFAENEKSLLKDRRASLNRTFLINDSIRWTLLSIIAITCILGIVTINRQQKDNDNLFEALQNSNTHLERTVEHRTSELERSNSDLLKSIDRIKMLNSSIEKRNLELQGTLTEVQLLYDHAPCGYHTVSKEGVIVRMNKTELDWLGYEDHEVVGRKTVEDLLTDDGLRNRTEMVKELQSVGKINGIETEFRRKDGSLMPVLLNTIAYFDPDGHYLMNRSTVFDITTRKTLEDQLRQANDHLLQLNDEKDRFLATATHDLKNPINNMFGILDLLRHNPKITEGLSEYLDLMESVLKKMKDLVERLLNLNEIEQTEKTGRFERIDLDRLLSGLASRFRIVASKKEIELICENRLPGQHVISDGMLLEQVLDNLVSNAIKFSSFRRCVWLRIRMADGFLIFEVEDQGPGIRPEEQIKLFRTFQRLSATPTGGETSTGLGLSIVKAIASQLGGQIGVESEFGKGATFTLKIPHKV